MDEMVSIVVPVYGVEKYIDECIQSLQDQTYTNLEILLVDDGGKDRSAQICEEYAAKDSRIKVIHKKNGGAASARNVGIDAATGEYICFIDGDDRIGKDYVMHLWQILKEADADISECGLYYWTKVGTEPIEIQYLGVADRNEYLKRFTLTWTCALMTNKLFKRSVVGTVRFEEGHCIDDEFFTYQVVMNGQKVVSTDNPLYYYRIRSSSVMQNVGQQKERVMLDRVEYMTTRYQNIAKRVPEIEPEFFEELLHTMIRFWKHSKQMPTAQKQIRSWAKAHRSRIMAMKKPLRRRMGYLYRLMIVRPSIVAEPNPIQMDLKEVFE